MPNTTPEVHPPKGNKLSFENTEIAFKGKSNAYLKRAYWLFKLISIQFLTKIGPPITSFAMKIGLPVKALIKSTLFRHFCGGETIRECEPVIIQLAAGKVGSILDYSVEGEDEETVFDLTRDEIIQTILRSKGDERIPLTVFKVTGIGRFGLLEKSNAKQQLTKEETMEFILLKERINRICKTAFDCDVPVMIDAEESWIQDTIDILAIEMIRAYNREKPIVYNTYQLYRKDKLASLKADVYLAQTDNFILGAKLVRGAYMKKERKRAAEMGLLSPIHDTKEAVDLDYDVAIRFCVQNIDHAGFVAGTHNENSCRLVAELLDEHQIAHSNRRIYFSQLLGMSDNLSFNLADAGYNVSKYVPYGPVQSVLPYLFRRAEENTSISGQMSRELSLILKEMRRRKMN